MIPRLLRPALLSVAVIAFVAASAWIWTQGAVRKRGVDFYHFWAVPSALRDAGVRDPYTPEGRAALHAFMERRTDEPGERRMARAQAYWTESRPSGTPWFYALLAGFAVADYERGYRLFQAASFVSGALVLALLGWMLRVPLPAIVGSLALVAFSFEPLLSDTRVANVNRFVLVPLVAYALFAWLRERQPARVAWPVASGFVLGAAILFKPVLVFSVASLGLNRLLRARWRHAALECAGGVAAAAVALVATKLYFGDVAVWLSWLRHLDEIVPDTSATVAMGNFGLRPWLMQTIGPGAGLVCALLAGTVLAAQVLVLRGAPGAAPRQGGRFHEDLAALGLGLVLFVLVSRLVWLHYYVLTLPALMLVLTVAVRRRARVLGGLSLLAVAGIGTGTAGPILLGTVALAVALLDVLRTGPGAMVDAVLTTRNPDSPL